MGPSTTSYVSLAVAIVLTAIAVWARVGRGPSARAWTRAASESGVRLTLFVLPGVGLLGLALGVTPWLDEVPGAGLLLVVLIGVGAVCLFGWGIMQLPYPRWTVPAWARDIIARRFEKERWLR